MSLARVKLIKALIDLNEKIFFERRLVALYKKWGGFEIIIDVGANKGQSIDLFLRINPNCEIYSIEANPTLYNLLVKKYQATPNVHLFNIGISSSNGQKLFHENLLDYTSSFEALNMNSKYLEKKAKILGVGKEGLITKTYEIPTLTLSKFIEQNLRDKKIDLIKIDTEGHELQCLLGLFSDSMINLPRYIQIEQHLDDMYANTNNPEEINHLLLKNRYREVKSLKHGFGEFYEKIFQLG